MKKQPLCSVVIPSYNKGNYLEECVESVFAQTYPNWELVIVDDCSTDGTCDEVLRKYESDSRVRIFRNDRNHGIGYTKNRCVSLAEGELCLILDHDDFLLPEALEILADHHRRKPGAAIVCARKNWCDAELNPRFPDAWEYEGDEVRFADSHEHVRVSHPCMFKMDLYRQTEGIDPGLPIGEDHDMYLKLGEVGEVWCIKAVLHNYRVHEGATSVDDGKNWARYWSLVVTMRACERTGEDPEVVIPKTFADYDQNWMRRLRKERLRYQRSHAYRLGRILLSPARAARRLFPSGSQRLP